MTDLQTERELLVTAKEGDVWTDCRLHVSADATVGDVLNSFGRDPETHDLVLHARALPAETLLSETTLLHGDELEFVAARRKRGLRVRADAWAPIALVQLDGSDRGRVIGVPAAGKATLWLVAVGDQCRTRVARRSSASRGSASLTLSWIKDRGLATEANGRAEVDGEVVHRLTPVLAGSVIRLEANYPSPTGEPWALTFVATDRENITRGLSGWVPYRVISTGKNISPSLDEADVRVAPKPREPQEKPISDYVFEFLPAIGLIVLMATRGTAIIYALIYSAIYGVRIFAQVFKHRRDVDAYESALADWQKQCELAVEKFTEHVLREHQVRQDALHGAFSTAEVWRALNRMEGLWERSRQDPYFLSIWVGNGRWRSDAVFPIPGGLDNKEYQALQQSTNDRRFVPVAPIAVSALTEHVAVVGPRNLARQVLNLAVADLAVNHSPLDVRFVFLLPGDGDDIADLVSWAKWLPHVRSAAGVLGQDRIFRGRKKATEWLTEFRARIANGPLSSTAHPFVVIVLHEGCEPDIAALEDIIKIGDGKVRLLWWGPTAARVPSVVTQRVFIEEVTHDDGSPASALVDAHMYGHAGFGDVAPTNDRTGVPGDSLRVLLRSTNSPDKLRAIARSLAPLADERSSYQSSSIPDKVPLHTFTAPSPATSPQRYAQIRDSWKRSTTAEALNLRLGIGAGSVVAVDLAKLGPHMLVGGTTGSGKSQFLQSMVADAVATYGPSELQLCLIDFKGGSAFDSFAGLEHLAAEASNLDPARMSRAISFLFGELDYRMGLLREARCKDYDEFRIEQELALPRMLVVLDEYAAAQATFPEVRQLTDTIAARGRSLGVHVVFATQNPAGAITADMQTNIGARVCLRMLSDADAKSVVMDPSPARIPVDLPGRAFIRLPDGELQEFQSPFATADVQVSIGAVRRVAFSP